MNWFNLHIVFSVLSTLSPLASLTISCSSCTILNSVTGCLLLKCILGVVVNIYLWVFISTALYILLLHSDLQQHLYYKEQLYCQTSAFGLWPSAESWVRVFNKCQRVSRKFLISSSLTNHMALLFDCTVPRFQKHFSPKEPPNSSRCWFTMKY